MTASDVIVMPYRPVGPDDMHYSVSGVLHLALSQGRPIVVCSNPKFVELENIIPELVVPSMDLQSRYTSAHFDRYIFPGVSLSGEDFEVRWRNKLGEGGTAACKSIRKDFASNPF